MELSLKELQPLMKGFSELGNLPIEDKKIMYMVGRNLRKLSEVFSKWNERQKRGQNRAVRQWVKKGENGHPIQIRQPNGEVVYDFENPEHLKRYEKDIEEVEADNKVEVELWKVKRSFLVSVPGMKANIIALLMPVVEDDIKENSLLSLTN